MPWNYKRRMKNDLRAHPLAARLQSCDSPSAIIVLLQEQVLTSVDDRIASVDNRVRVAIRGA